MERSGAPSPLAPAPGSPGGPQSAAAPADSHAPPDHVPEREATSASAEPPPFDTRWFIAPMIGFSTDGLNAGLGLRAGKTLPNHLYIGGSFIYNTGESQTYYPYAGYSGYGAYGVAAASASASLYYLGPEVGYDFELKYVTLRAYGGVGVAHASVSYRSGVSAVGYPYAGVVPSVAVSGSVGSTSVALWPGVSVLYTIPRSMFFVGGDVRVLISTGNSLAEGISNDPALGLFAFGGVKFGS